ncbi:MAG: glycine zipper 2TM domain-containing protein [Steroidobacteraceae bacterium]
MPNPGYWILPVLLAALSVQGCATPANGQVYSRQESKVAWDVHYGKVLAIDEAVIEGERTALGRIGGGLVGYQAGRTIGGGSGRRIAGAVGAVAGAVAGQAIEKRATRQDAWQFMVELDGGRTVAIVQARDQTFAIGERVRIYMRRDGAARVAKA